MEVKDKVVIVTGAGGGMGKSVVHRFLERGAKVVAVDIDTTSVAELVAIFPGQVLVLKANLTNEKEVTALVRQTVDRFSRVDVLINVAGIAQSAKNIEEVSLKEWEKIMAVNSTALFLTCREVVPFMKERKKGVIINVASISVERPRPGLNAYIASKGAAVSLTKALAIELAPFHIRVNGINPGPSDTKMLGQFTPADGDQTATKENTFLKSVPLGELITPEDIAYTALYLSSDQARMITGSIVNVDGGRGL